MKPIRIFMIAVLLSTLSAGFIAQGQTRKRVPTRGRKTTPAKPAKATAMTSTVTTTRSGLIYVITRRSTTGRLPRSGETVVVNYTGLLGTGVKFDSSLDRGQTFKFKLGEGRVIKGWDEGIAKLRVGEQATLIIPPDLGYVANGAGGGEIPPNATLIFIVELIGIEEAPTSN